MQPTSEAYNQLLVSQNYHLETQLKVKVGSTYKVIGEDKLMSMSVTRKVFQNGKPEVGGCVCAEINIEMLLPTFDIPRKAEMRPFVRLISNEMDDYEDGNFLLDAVEQRTTVLTDTSKYSEFYYFDSNVDLYEGKVLTVEYDYAVDGVTTSTATLYSQLNGTIVSESDEFPVESGDIGHHTATFTVTNAQASSSNNRFRMRMRYANEGAEFTISNVKIYTTPSEWIQKGVYYLDTRQVTNNNDNLDVLVIHGYDTMIMAEQNYAKSTLSFPANDIAVVRDIASKLKVGVESHTVELINKTYKVQLPTQYTLREILGFIAGMYAGNFVMNDEGNLQLVSLYELPPETNILIDEGGFYITFGVGEEETRILLKEE